MGKEKGGKKTKSRLTTKKEKKVNSSLPQWRSNAMELGPDATYVGSSPLVRSQARLGRQGEA